jgi:alkylation response protein AidB-like acyl-CoA dehydrogenase
MNFDLDEEQLMLVDMARQFAATRVAPGAAERDETSTFPSELILPLAEQGFMGMLVPEEHGGSAMGYVNYALALAEIARGCASTAVTMAVNNLTASAVATYASDELKAEVLPDLCLARGGKVGAFALSEPHCGSDAAALKTRAERVGDDYILNGSKQWITNGAFASWILVMARTGEGPKGISAFVVPGDADGLIVGPAEKKMGLKASNTVSLTLENLRIPARYLVGDEGIGFAIAMNALDGGRIGIGAQSLGIGRAALREAASYMEERSAFGKPLSRHQALQFMIADMGTDLEATRLFMLKAASLRDAGLPMSQIASMCKVFASESCCRAVDAALQIHGGYGYVKEFAIERLYRDARVTRIYEGTSEIQRVVISRNLLKGMS